MSSKFCVAVFDYDELLVLAQTENDRMPNAGEYIKIDFKDPKTLFIAGSWGEKGVAGRIFSFYVSPVSRLVEWNDLDVLECLLECEIEES